MSRARTIPPDVHVRPFASAAEIRAAEDLQFRVWGFDPVEVVPLHVLLTSSRHGGCLLGAWDGERLVGFAFGFRGTDPDGTPVLCSHLLAVDREARGRGIGRALKWAQRTWALAAGLGRVVWTFDPLEHGNARLNLSHLGATSDRYLVDLYGELRDELNAGLPTDRLEVVWELEDATVRRLAEEGVPARVDPGPLLDPDGPGGRHADPTPFDRVRLRAPADAQALRREDPAGARAWRMHLREGLLGTFARGYRLVGAGDSGEGPEYRLARHTGLPRG